MDWMQLQVLTGWRHWWQTQATCDVAQDQTWTYLGSYHHPLPGWTIFRHAFITNRQIRYALKRKFLCFIPYHWSHLFANKGRSHFKYPRTSHLLSGNRAKKGSLHQSSPTLHQSLTFHRYVLAFTIVHCFPSSTLDSNFSVNKALNNSNRNHYFF